MAETETTEGAARLFIIGGTPIPGINGFRVDLEDIDTENTNRDETGKLHRDVLRKSVMKLAISAVVPTAEVERICGLIKETTFEASVYCPLHPDAAGGYATGVFYVSKKSIQLLSYSNGYWTISFNAVEV